ncbi:MAG TPA: hypothetical protein VFL96_07895, partial [Acidobacteriaceae bacterium]|nr:hypothetical protein [Acidobacteriaceae bacterium]
AFAVTVAGTPVSLTLSPASVAYAGQFSVTATVTGNAVDGAPAGTVTLYGSRNGATFTLGTVTLTASGNNGTGSGTYTAVGPNLNVGTYQIYGYFTPSNSAYQAGSSPNVTLTVTPEPTSLGLGCTFNFFAVNCTATVTASTTGTPVPAGNAVDFTLNGGAATVETTNAAGQATYNPGGIFFGSYTVLATFPQQSNYLTSSDSKTILCAVFGCFGGSARRIPVTLNSFSGLGLNANTSASGNGFRRAPFTLF